ncbi:MAG TPA: kelch repeat-containing protein [Polyangia bacterium]|nr:kelch repeat-containing protein [Polyangia bacterium]
MRLVLVAVLALAVTGCPKTGPGQCPSPLRPSARSEMTPVFVPTTNQIYLYGGQGSNLPLDDLWRYSLSACTGWTQLVLPTNPGPLTSYAATYDTMRDRIIYVTTNGTWALDTDHLTFTKLSTVGSQPGTNGSSVAIYDAEHDRVVYAGIGTSSLDFGMSDQGNWTFLASTSLEPGASGVLDPTRNMLVVLDTAGLHGFSFLTNTWQDIAQGGTPPSATGAELAWDDGVKSVVAVADGVWTGTIDANASTIMWSKLPTTGDPPPRTAFGLTVSGDELWLSGGRDANGCILDDLWTFDLRSLAWSNVWPSTTCL